MTKLLNKRDTPQLLFDVDECSVVLFQTGNGRKSKSVHMLRGKRAMMKQKNCNKYKRVTVIAAASQMGVEAYLISNLAGTTIATYMGFLLHAVFPKAAARNEHICIMQDNLSSHTAPEVARLCHARGHLLVNRPKKRPDMAPIEHVFSNLKMYLDRHVRVLTEDNLKQHIRRGLQQVTAHSCQGYFRHCGY
jgi:transposase